MPLEDRPYERRVKKSVLIDHAMKLHTDPQECVFQAGGHVGVWPNRLVEYFDVVYTFEPHPDNFAELIKNTNNNKKIHAFNWALGSDLGSEELKFSEKSTGMHHIADKGDITVDVISIDWAVRVLDIVPNAIFLDVEGYEMEVLYGGIDTIRTYRPLITCEENDAGKRYGIQPGMIGKWLSKFGYKLGRKYKKDLIFCPI